jgi:ABC-type uncharacterized transport system substrate-binding protein
MSRLLSLRSVSWFALIFVALAMLGCANSANANKRILVIHSYDDGFRWTHEQQRGIVEGLRRSGLKQGVDYTMRVFYMDTRIDYTAPDQVQQRARLALQIIDSYDPDLVFVTDDTALQYVAVPHATGESKPDLPFIFSGINGDPTSFAPIQSLDKPGGPITGTLERIPFADALAAAKTMFPDTTRVALLADSSASSAAVVQDFGTKTGSLPSGITVTGFDQIDTFEHWKQTIQEDQGKVDAIGVLNYHRLKDENGDIVPADEVARWTIENSHIPVFGLVSDWASDGLVMATGNSGYKTGSFVGIEGARVLDGADPGTMPIIDPGLIETSLNLDTARATGVTIPPAVLASAAAVFP